MSFRAQCNKFHYVVGTVLRSKKELLINFLISNRKVRKQPLSVVERIRMRKRAKIVHLLTVLIELP